MNKAAAVLLLSIFISCTSSSDLVKTSYSSWLTYWVKHPPKNPEQKNKFDAQATDILRLLIAEIRETDARGSVSNAMGITEKLSTFNERIKAMNYPMGYSTGGKIHPDTLRSYIIYAKCLPSIIGARNSFYANNFETCILEINQCDTSNARVKRLKSKYISGALNFYKDEISRAELNNDLFAETDNILLFSSLESTTRIKFSNYHFQTPGGDSLAVNVFLKQSRLKCYNSLKSKIANYISARDYNNANNHIKYARRIANPDEQKGISDLENSIHLGGVQYYLNLSEEQVKEKEWEKALKTLDDIKNIDPNIDINDKKGRVYLEWGKVYKDELHNFPEAIKQFKMAKEILHSPADADDYIEKTNLLWGNDLLKQSEELLSNEDCKQAYYKAFDARQKLQNLSNSAVSSAVNIMSEAKECASRRLAIVVKNSADYNLYDYNSNLLSGLRKACVNNLDNIFINLTDEAADADYVLVFQIKNANSSSSNNTYNIDLCTQQFIAQDAYHVWYRYWKRLVTRNIQRKNASIEVSVMLKDNENGILINEDFQTVKGSWSNEYWTSNINPAYLFDCPPGNYTYGTDTYYLSGIQPKEQEYLNNSYRVPPTIESIINQDLHQQCLQLLNKFMKDVNKL